MKLTTLLQQFFPQNFGESIMLPKEIICSLGKSGEDKKVTWNSTPARGPWKPRSLKSFVETVTTRAAFAHFDERRENDMPLIHSSPGFVLVRTT